MGVVMGVRNGVPHYEGREERVRDTVCVSRSLSLTVNDMMYLCELCSSNFLHKCACMRMCVWGFKQSNVRCK